APRGAQREVRGPRVDGDRLARDELVDEVVRRGGHASIGSTADWPGDVPGRRVGGQGRCMDLDALAAARAAEWDRLERLGRAGALTGAEADELITRYQAAASDLSAVQAAAGPSAVGARLSVLIARARLRFAG